MKDPGRYMKLAEEDGHEVWIDFQTGAVIDDLVRQADVEQPANDSPTEVPPTMTENAPRYEVTPDFGGGLMAPVRAMLDGHGYRYNEIDARAVSVAIRNTSGVYTVFFRTNDETDLVRVLCSYASYIPEDRRAAVAEVLARINARLWVGNFELDFADGEVRHRVSIDVENGLLSEKMVDNMMGFTLSSMDRFHQAVMRVAFGGVEPAVALDGL